MIIKRSKIPTILGIIILLAGTFLGVFYLNMTQVFRIGASPQEAPKDVRISNIADNTATISWTTDAESSDFLNWGTSQNSLSQVLEEDSSGAKYQVHSVTLTGLKASSPYYFKINSQGTTYDNNGIPWQLTTGPVLGLNSISYPISGSVINASGNPEKRALVYLNVNGYLLSTLTSDTGNFVLQLGNIRSSDLSSYPSIDPAQTLLQISITSPDGVSSVQVFPQSSNPIPAIVIGQIYDLRSLQPNQNAQSPGVDLQLPQTATPESKFNTETATGSGKTTSVILESLNEGEVVTSTQPEFFGKGPAGETINISVHSETPVTDSVTIPQNGSWSWSPPEGLAPGNHTITITWIDTTGITRSLTRDFVVQAGEAPAFTASSSGATSTSSPTATPTVAPSASPTASPLASLTPTPTSVATSSAEPIPVTGDSLPTALMVSIGSLILFFSFGLWKLSEN